jgi:retron-type reverse transcriptase
MSLQTPEKIRTLQRKLNRKAKDEPEYRFYLLYDKICREDMLAHAYELAKANRGASGLDGQSFEQIEEQGQEKWLAEIRDEIRTRRYKPQPVRRVMIPKAGGGERPLGIPTIRDWVVQTAAKLVLEPIFEADLEPCGYGYRPKRSAQSAIKEVHRRIAPLITMSRNVFVFFCVSGDRCRPEARALWRTKSSLGRWGCCICVVCTWVPVRESGDETCRRAGCGKSSRPVR